MQHAECTIHAKLILWSDKDLIDPGVSKSCLDQYSIFSLIKYGFNFVFGEAHLLWILSFSVIKLLIVRFLTHAIDLSLPLTVWKYFVILYRDYFLANISDFLMLISNNKWFLGSTQPMLPELNLSGVQCLVLYKILYSQFPLLGVFSQLLGK